MPHALGKDNNDNGYKTLYDLIISSKGKEIDAALDVASDMNISIIDPRETNPDKIQYQWDKYIGMPKPLRLVADYVTQDHFGMDNTLLHHYTYNRAMRNTENDKYDLIMLDDMMPKMSGVKTLKKLKAIPGFNIKTVALTANALTGMREKYLSDGFDDYLAKPINKDELNKIINKYLNDN